MTETESNLPYVARVCGLFVRDKNDLALVDLCHGSTAHNNNNDMKDKSNEPTLFMATLGKRNTDELNLTYAMDGRKGIKMGQARNGNIIVIEFTGRKRFIRINLDDNKGISITLQVVTILIIHNPNTKRND